MLDALFVGSSFVALTIWILLAVAPAATRRHAVVPVFALLVSVAYALLLVVALGEDTGGGFGSLGELRALFASDAALLAGWLHYLAFDLLVGSWMTLDAERARIPRGVLVPALLLTFFAGPLGFGVYLLARLALRRGLAGPGVEQP